RGFFTEQDCRLQIHINTHFFKNLKVRLRSGNIQIITAQHALPSQLDVKTYAGSVSPSLKE
ncbi:hypothetical protein TI03_05040, partial [Achromatium sp. WMS1]